MNGKRAKLIRKALGLDFSSGMRRRKPLGDGVGPSEVNRVLNQYRRAKRAYTANKGAF